MDNKSSMKIPILLVVSGIVIVIASAVAGNTMGGNFGTAVGIGVGSYRSVGTFVNAYEEGKDEALQVKDTEISVATGLDGEGEKLQVLVARTTMVNLLTMTNESFNWDYKRLEQLYFDVVFTVDLSKAKLSEGSVVIPEPEVTLYSDESARNVLAEYNGLPFAGSAEDGFDISMNSMKEIVKNAKENLANYDDMFSRAKSAAKVQVADLYRSMGTDGKPVEVSFFASESGKE